MRLSPICLALLAGCGSAAALDTMPPGIAHGADASVPRRSASLGENRASLGADDPMNDGQAYFHVWRIELDPTRRVRIRMSSSALDPLVEVRGPGSQHLRNDDAFPGMLDAFVDFVPQEPGAYEIWATTYAAHEMGEYTLTIEARDLAGVGVPLALGGATTSSLGTQGMQRGLPGSWLHFEGSAGSIVRLRVTSQAFDTIATLIGPGGQTWVNDDANDLGENRDERSLDSTIVAALPQTGVYQLVVTPYGQGAGPFRVRSSVRPPILYTGGRRPEGLAGASGGGRLLGVYAGITAYHDQGQLYGCADDARLLGEAMRDAHLQDESDQLVLPDGLATREAFLAGIAQVASQSREEDVALIFFSGHGNQTPDATENGDELDRLDETIVLFDGPLSDDEVVQALGAIRAGTVILALDSCHSGGFARDWVTRPGRMGVFSSDEDVLSDVAQPHQAGGYLSWHLRRGVLGEADSRPRDGVLHAGELTDYLYDGFVADHRLMNAEGEMEPAQRLVVNRGSVTWDQVVWIYPRNEDLTLPPIPDNPLTSIAP